MAAQPRGPEQEPAQPPQEPMKSARSGDTPEQREADVDVEDKEPAEGAAEDYDADIPGASEPPD